MCFLRKATLLSTMVKFSRSSMSQDREEDSITATASVVA